MRTFTLTEAQTLIPVLDALLLRAQSAAIVATTRDHALQSLAQAIFLSGGLRVDLAQAARVKAEHATAITEARDTLEEIAAIGVEVHDLSSGILEFPFQLGNDIVMLCWLQGDTTITQWHEAESSWDERLPLDERFTRGDRSQ